MLLFALIIPSVFQAFAYGKGDLGASADKWVGTSSKEVELAIAAGKTLLDNPGTMYTWGGGHGDKLQDKDKPEGLDCSGFSDWAYKKGPGVQVSADYGYVTWDMPEFGGKFYKDTSNPKDFSRGDLLLCNDGKHVVIVLGVEGDKVTIIGSNGGSNLGSGPAFEGKETDKDGGVSIKTAEYMTPYLGVVKMKELIEAKQFKEYPEAKRLKGLSVTGSTGGSKTEGNEESNADGTSGANTTGVIDDTFEVNGLGTKNAKDWNEVDVAANLPTEGDLYSLSASQRQTLTDWLQESEKDGLVTLVSTIRTGIMLLAILLILFSLLLIVAYAFDRIGVLDFSVLSVITGGKLYTVYEKEDNTFFNKESVGGKGVTGGTLFILLIISLIMALLILTGKAYKISFTLITGVTQLVETLTNIINF